MRNEKSVSVSGGKEVVVKEVQVKRVLRLFPFLGGEGEGDDAQTGFMENLDELLQECCGLSVSDLEELYSSDLERLWRAFKEVNSFFFKVVENLGLSEKLAQILATLLESCGGMFADLFAVGIKDALITDSAGS